MSTNIESNFGEREKYAEILSPKGTVLQLVVTRVCGALSLLNAPCAGADGNVNYDLLGKILTAKSLEEVCACSFGIMYTEDVFVV